MMGRRRVITVRNGPRRLGWTRTAAIGALVAMVASACSHPSRSAQGPRMTLQVSSGTATVVGGGTTTKVTSQLGVSVGYRVSIDPHGLAALQLAAGRSFELLGGDTPGEVLITAEDRLQLVQGDVLGQLTAHGQVDGQGVSVAGDSATFRLDALAPARVAVYAGNATLTASGTSSTVAQYRQVALAGGAPGAVVPLQFTGGGDVWDHRFLQDALDLDSRLATFSGGLNAQLGGASGMVFFEQVLPGVAPVLYQPYLAQPRADVLIGWVIAGNAVVMSHGDPGTIFSQVLALHAQNESWGLLAKEYRVGADAVFSGLLDAIHRAGISAGSPTPHFVVTPAPTIKPGTTPTPAVTSPAGSPTPVPTTPAPAPSGLSGLLAPVTNVLNPVTQLLNAILNLLFPQATPTPSH